MKSWIYFARYGEHGPIKIGRGDNPRRRVADFNVGTPAQLILLDGMLSDQAVEEEDELHDRLRAFHVRGEWYDAEIVLEEMKRLGSRLVGADQISECQLRILGQRAKISTFGRHLKRWSCGVQRPAHRINRYPSGCVTHSIRLRRIHLKKRRTREEGTTSIRVRGETWHVPRGFGKAYARAAKDDLELARAAKPGEVIGSIIDLLALIGYDATIAQVATGTSASASRRLSMRQPSTRARRTTRSGGIRHFRGCLRIRGRERPAMSAASGQIYAALSRGRAGRRSWWRHHERRADEIYPRGGQAACSRQAIRD